jgi:hypothetical protein
MQPTYMTKVSTLKADENISLKEMYHIILFIYFNWFKRFLSRFETSHSDIKKRVAIRKSRSTF